MSYNLSYAIHYLLVAPADCELLMQEMQLGMEGEIYGDLSFILDAPEPTRLAVQPSMLSPSSCFEMFA